MPRTRFTNSSRTKAKMRNGGDTWRTMFTDQGLGEAAPHGVGLRRGVCAVASAVRSLSARRAQVA